MSEDDPENVSRPKFGEQRKAVVTGYRECHHRGDVTIDANARTLTCDRCGALLDPVEWLADWAKRDDYLRHEEKEANRLMHLISALTSRGGGINFRRSGIEIRWPKNTKTNRSWSAVQHGLAYDLERALGPVGPRPLRTEGEESEG